jgi:hypothetical protein
LLLNVPLVKLLLYKKELLRVGPLFGVISKLVVLLFIGEERVGLVITLIVILFSIVVDNLGGGRGGGTGDIALLRSGFTISSFV